MKISIIIPAYNSENFINRCLDSVIKQTLIDWECLIIDDGSKDSTGSICDEYASKDSRFKVIHKINEGVSKARNVGLDLITGDWVTFCDSDDELTPNALESFNEAKKKYPDAQILRGGHTTKTTTGKVKDRAVEEWIQTSNHAEALRISENSFCSGFMWSTCFRRDIIENERFDSDITWCEDHIFTYRCMLKCSSIVFVPAVVYIYYLDDRYPIGYGKDLSFKAIDYKMAIRSAEAQKKIKLKLAQNDSEMIARTNWVHDNNIRLAIYYSLFQIGKIGAFKLAKSYYSIKIIDFLKILAIYYKRKARHKLNLISHKY